MRFVIVLGILAIVLVSFFGLRYVGYAIQTPSSVTIVGSQSHPQTETPSGGGGGGGGGASTPEFTVSNNSVTAVVKQSESSRESITVKNGDKTEQTFTLTLSKSLDGLVFISDPEFVLQPGEEKTVELFFVSLNDTSPGVYTGYVDITAGKSERIPVVFEVKSKEVLFDVKLEIPNKYKELLPDEAIFFQVSLFNLGETRRADVSLEYIVKDLDNNVLFSQEEVVAVETQASLSRTFNLPKNLQPGKYVVMVYARYQDSVSTSSVIFNVLSKEEPKFFSGNVSLRDLVIVGIVIILIIVIFFLLWRRKADVVESRVKSIVKKDSPEVTLLFDDD